MATKRTSVVVVDKKESLPLKVNHLTREWEIFDPATNSYKSTGIKAIPEDDATAVKYYKLTNTLTAPTAPGDTQTSWADIASLNTAVITNGGWSADPLQVSKDNRFCWAAYYSLENTYDVSTGAYARRYKLNLVGLYNNYAASPAISVGEDGRVTITNPDGTTQTVQLMTAGSYDSLEAMVSSLQSQVDSAIYSYSGSGAPTKTHTLAPISSWGIPVDAPNNIVADIYSAHVGDTYTDTDTYVSYRFILKGGYSVSDPLSYEWQVISDGALSAALAEIAALGNKSVKIFTTQPTAPYKIGDMWVDKGVDDTVVKTCIVAKDTNGTFAEIDWIIPFATKAEVEVIRGELETAKTNISTTQGNISELETHVTNLETVTLVAMEDNLISESERQAIKSYKNAIDTEQEQIQSNVSYITSSTYLSAEQKALVESAGNKLMTVTTGSLDKLQAAIASILNTGGEQGNIITTVERTAYESALATYKTDLADLNAKIATARAQIDAELKRLADEKVDNLQIGGRNYILNSGNFKKSTYWANYTDCLAVVENSRLKITGGTAPLPRYRNSSKIPTLNTPQLYHIVIDYECTSFVRFGGKYYSPGSSAEYGGWDAVVVNNVDLGGNKKRGIYNVVLSATNSNIDGAFIYIYIPQNTILYLDSVSMVQGDKPMLSWSPAPEDVQAEIDAAVIKATYWSIKSTSPVIYKDANSATANGVHTPITVIGELRSGTTTTPGGFISVQPNGGAESSATASPRTITPTDTEGKTSYTVRLYDTATKTILLDTMTIPVVFKGSSGINVAMSNESDVLHADSSGVVTDYADSGNVIRVFEGATELDYDGIGTSNGKFNVTATATGITVGAKSENILQCVFGNPSNMTSNKATVTFTITGKTLSGVDFSITKQQSFSKSKTGVAGADGAGISQVVEWFLASNQSTGITNATAGFTTTISPITEINKYLWNYEEIQYTDARSNYKTPARIIGVYGEKGVGIASITDYYLASTLPTGITKATVGWDTDVPVLDAVNKYLWNYEVVTYTEGTPKEIEPAIIGVYGDTGVGSDGVPGADALIVTVNVQGHFRNYYEREVVGGVETWVLKKEIVGGVLVDTTEYVKATATIRKGSSDVTVDAIAKGANLTWYVGSTMVKQAGTAVDANILYLGTEYADGTDDQIHLDYDDTNANTWGGGVGAVTPTFSFSIDDNGNLIYNVTFN